MVGDLRLGAPALQPAGGPATAAAAPAADSGAAADAISALVNLGYKRMEAFTAVHAVLQRLGPDTPVGELIRHGLQELAP
jgi:Holliday junction DNA helicase RuvA